MRHVLAAAAVLTATGLAAAPPAPALAQAAKPKPKPRVSKFFPYWEAYQRIPAAERTRFQLAYRLLSDDKPLTDVPLFAVDGARREPIAIAADGRMRPPSTEFFRSKTAVIDIEGPSRGRSAEVNLELLATAQPAREMDATVFTATLDQANAGIRKAAGPIGLVAPKMARIVFTGAGSGEAVGADGRRTPLPSVKGESGPYYQPGVQPGVQRLVFARAPSKLMIGPAVKKKR